MARPCKSVKSMSKNLTKEEKEARLKAENKLKGGADKISPPKYLNKNQKKIFRNIVKELKESWILEKINEKPDLIYSKDLRLANDKYTKDFFRCCNELSLSPQSRAKFANINLEAEKEKEDPLLKVLRGG